MKSCKVLSELIKQGGRKLDRVGKKYNHTIMKYSYFIFLGLLLLIQSCSGIKDNDPDEINRIKSESIYMSDNLKRYMTEDTSVFISEEEKNKYLLLKSLLNTKEVENSKIDIKHWEKNLHEGLAEFSEAGYGSAKQIEGNGTLGDKQKCLNSVKEKYRNCLNACKGNYECGSRCTQTLFDGFDSCKNRYPATY